MAGSVGKFAPSAIVLAAVGYCCWPYLEDPGRRPKVDDGKKLPELTANILSPKIIPAPGRDPFGMTGDHELFKVFDATAGKKDKNAAKKLSAEEEKAALEKAKEEAARKAAEAAEAARKAVQQELQVAVSSVVLNGTYLNGAQRVAIINREVFVQGQSLEKVHAGSRPIKIAEVQVHKVVLELEGQTADLTFESTGAKPEEGPPVVDPVPTARSVFGPARSISLTAPKPAAQPRAAPASRPVQGSK